MRGGAICAAILISMGTITFAQGAETQDYPRIITPAPTQVGYADSTVGLRDLLNDMWAAARDRDSSRLRVLIASTEIPDYANWFEKTFGEVKGPMWAAAYGKTRARREAELQNEIMLFAQRPGYFSAKEIVPTDVYDTLQTPLDLFLANWSPPDVDGLKRRRTAIGYFFYVRGKFCWSSGEVLEGR